jgi:hypothetical protein
VTASRTFGLCAVLLFAAATRLPAQTTTAGQMLERAVRLYEDVELEDAVAILRRIVSPSEGLDASATERAQAYKYLGAVCALQPGPDKRDSAIAYLREAVALDPFVELEAQTFTPAQLAVFAEARNRTFRVAVRPPRPDSLDSTSLTLTFLYVTSHAALVRAELRSDGATLLVLYDGPSDGPRAVTWDGTLPGRSLVPPGRYELAVVGRSSVLNLSDSAATYFDLQLEHPALEDTLPDLGPQDLLPEADANNQPIPDNVAENQRRQADRAASNSAVEQRNADVLRQAKRVITPVAGTAP